MLGKPLDVVLERPERDIAEFLARPFADGSPDVGLRERAQSQAITALADIEAEFGVEILWDGKIRHCEVEMVHRMDAELAGAADRAA